MTNKLSSKTKKIQKLTDEFKKTNPKVAEALRLYHEVNEPKHRMKSARTYKTTTSTRPSSIFTTR